MAAKKQRYSNAFTATLSGITDLFRKQQNVVTLHDAERLDGKNILITGASSGLGFEAAVQLAKRGACVLMACRSGIPVKGEQVKKLSGNKQVEMLQVDLSDLDSNIELVNKLKTAAVKLDGLVDNAGMVPAKSRKTKQGLEEMFVVNYLSKYLLTRLLLENDLFNNSANAIPRMIYVVSESHRNPKTFVWDEFGKYKEYSMGKTVEHYGYYKLLLATFASELSRKINTNDHVNYSVFALCPGPVNSNIAREAPAVFKPLLKAVFKIFFRSPKVAVQPVIYFAASSEVQGKAMDYLFLMQRKEMDEKAVDEENGQKLWQLSERLLKEHGIVFRK
ncbi:MAG TPA: SDR family NAD(P)-dependent oxidoreductase [Chitinophagales bacterium]|nr:SDR family NAD(P)-dependent oxidoreductase [Chitinophagales bacterium]